MFCLFLFRPDTVRCACDTLAICAVISNAQLQLCQNVELPSEVAESTDIGLLVILDAARGELSQDPVMQRAALSVIVNCVCGPFHRLGNLGSKYEIIGGIKIYLICTHFKNINLAHTREMVCLHFWSIF
jgi:HIV-1 Vpr-binding protein